MKKTLYVALLLLPLLTHSQLFVINQKPLDTTNVYQIDSLGKKGILLNYAWRYIYKDDSTFAQVNFNDSNWKKIGIDDEFNRFEPIINHTVGWFRKKIYVDSALVNQPLIISINIKGAAEIYLDGKKIHTIGRFKKEKKSETLQFFTQPLPYSITFNKAGEHTLAVRFLFIPDNFLMDRYDFFPMSMRLRSIDGYVQDNFDNKYSNARGITVGLFLMMAFIHFFFYRFFKSKQYNLPFFIAMLLFGVGFYLTPSALIYSSKSLFLSINFLNELFYLLGHLLLMYALYLFLNYPLRLLFSTVVFTVLFLKILSFGEWLDSGIANVLMYGSLLINYGYLVWRAHRHNDPNGKVLIRAIIAFLVTFASSFFLLIVIASFTISIYSSTTEVLNGLWLPIFINLLVVGPQLCISGAISLGLAQEFVKTNLKLQKQVIEIERLSHEKEEILTTQNELLEQQVAQRTAELRASQAQLIQSEKLASLGELTAGIAHEIQNPLNFVNNFAELSVELIEECPQPPEGANEDWLPQDSPPGGWGAFWDDLRLNLQKINHHGKRASSIVKGMLEHSRMGTGVKELTDINKLADEYLRLSYHGIRAKDSSFNADYELITDKNLPLTNIVPQDIGRVLLNLINNAFQSKPPNPQKGNREKLKVIVKTFKIEANEKAPSGGVGACIIDNGSGIPADVLPKIFQPFFTTKPTGQGTGLGLSLAYDIITKGHGGTIECESVEGEGTTFVVKLPFTL